MLQRFADVVALQGDGLPIVGFGAWAAFGMVDWVSLLRRNDGVREDGIYTCVGAGETPQRTRVADVVTALAAGIVPAMPARAGWWERAREPVTSC
jgi:hypothetical protein